MFCRQHLFLVLLFIVSLIGFGALKLHNEGQLTSLFQQQQQAEPAMEVVEPAIIAPAPQKVNGADQQRLHNNNQILARAEHNEQVIAEAEAALQARIASQPTTVTYVVQKGDTLWSIAHQLLGDSAEWSNIYEQNKAELGDNPDLIFPGQTITITGVTTGVAVQ
jgi:nucleoid-associated protein YgaU